MNLERDIRFIRKVARFGILNPMADKLRLGEVADHIAALYQNDQDIGAALTLCMNFIAKHLSAIGNDEEAMAEAQTLLIALDRARTIDDTPDVDRSVILSGDAQGRLIASRGVVVERSFNGPEPITEVFIPAEVVPDDERPDDHESIKRDLKQLAERVRERDATIVETTLGTPSDDGADADGRGRPDAGRDDVPDNGSTGSER